MQFRFKITVQLLCLLHIEKLSNSLLTLPVPKWHICHLGVDCQMTFLSFDGWLPKRHLCRLMIWINFIGHFWHFKSLLLINTNFLFLLWIQHNIREYMTSWNKWRHKDLLYFYGSIWFLFFQSTIPFSKCYVQNYFSKVGIYQYYIL